VLISGKQKMNDTQLVFNLRNYQYINEYKYAYIFIILVVN
jgi:hypothetical protein